MTFAYFARSGFRHPPPPTETLKLSPCSFRKLNSLPYIYKTRYAIFMFTSSPGSYIFTNLFPVIAPRLEQSYITTTGRAYRAETHLYTEPLPENSVMTFIFWGVGEGELLAFPACSQTFEPSPPSFAHRNSQASRSVS